MKKYIASIVIILIIFLVGLTFWPKRDTNNSLEKVSVAEVAHSIFYAPMYAAKELGYFEDEGIDIDITLTAGADKVTAAVLSGDVNIGFCGSEATIYLYNQGVEDYLITFAGLTKRDGSFIVSRKKYDNFTLDDLKNSTIIGGRQGGMPEMTLEWALTQNGIDPKNDLYIDTSIAFAAMSGAFIGGEGDFVTLFEPTALAVEKAGYGYVVASVGEIGGIVPYTAFNAKKSYIEDNSEIIKGFTKAIQKGLDYVHNHTSDKIAKVILEEFPDITLNDLTTIIERYKNIDSWFTTTYIEEENFDHIQEIMESAGSLSTRVDFDKLVSNEYSEKE